MDERRLRYFLAVVEEGGVTRAARSLHVAQPSLSQALRTLERELGVELFQRVGRTLRLTAAGEALVGPARQTLRTMDSARAAVGEVVELAAGTLQIAALATLAVDPLSALVGRFRRAHPGVVVHVREPESASAVSTLVRAGECELGLAHLPLPQEHLRAVELGDQELLFVLPPGSDSGDTPRRPPGDARASASPAMLATSPVASPDLAASSAASPVASPDLAASSAASPDPRWPRPRCARSRSSSARRGPRRGCCSSRPCRPSG